jgi:hypothetical protein
VSSGASLRDLTLGALGRSDANAGLADLARLSAAKSGAPLERAKIMNRPFDNRPQFCH